MYFADAGGGPAQHKPAMFAHQKPMLLTRNDRRYVKFALIWRPNAGANFRVIKHPVYRISVKAPLQHQLISRPLTRIFSDAALLASVEINEFGAST